jgi:hypothetical protein
MNNVMDSRRAEKTHLKCVYDLSVQCFRRRLKQVIKYVDPRPEARLTYKHITNINITPMLVEEGVY